MTHWNKPDRPVILASQSPRRRQLLAQMGFAFESVSPDLPDEESYIRSDDLAASLQTLAAAKAATIAAIRPQALVLGMDTVVVLDNKVLGKPRDRADAFSMITLLSGKTHSVYTAAALLCRECALNSTAIARTNVTFRTLSDDEIHGYLDTGSHTDKAGAYGIQDHAMIFVDSIQGCFYNVMGLPVSATIGLFKRYLNEKGQH